MKKFKVKSLTPNVTSEQMENQVSSARFISFEACIQLFRQEYRLMELKEQPIGYRVTEQGIEMLY
jgi:hypothetical protein